MNGRNTSVYSAEKCGTPTKKHGVLTAETSNEGEQKALLLCVQNKKGSENMDRELELLAKLTSTPYEELETVLAWTNELADIRQNKKGGNNMNFKSKTDFAHALDLAGGDIGDAWKASCDALGTLETVSDTITNLRGELTELENTVLTLYDEVETSQQCTDSALCYINNVVEELDGIVAGVQLTDDERNDLHRAMMTLSRITNKILEEGDNNA